jgi:CO/xanthine dehydrogenase Mo-binding subunit
LGEEKIVGKPVLRKEGVAKVRGRAQYVDDLTLPGMLHGATVRSSIARGRILGIEFGAGIPWEEFVIVTATDIPGANEIALINHDWPCLAGEAVNHPEEAILLLAHPDRHLLPKAVAAVRVTYEEWPAVFSIEESERRDPIVWGEDNIFKAFLMEKGDVDAVWSQADHIIEGEYTTGAQEHLYIENNGAIAVYSADDGLTVWGSLQCPFYVHKSLVKMTGLPEEKVRIVQVETGGAFGGKEDYPSMIGAHAALLAMKSGKPVKIIYDRAEDMAATTKRHPSRIRHRTAVTREGKLLGAEIEIALDGGAYSTLSSTVLSRATIHAGGAYFWPNIRVRSKAFATNYPPYGAFRGFGAPQSLFAIERHMDHIAEELGIAPDELAADPGRYQSRSVDGARIGRIGLPRQARAICAREYWARNEEEGDRPGGVPAWIGIHGLGRAVSEFACGDGCDHGRKGPRAGVEHGIWTGDEYDSLPNCRRVAGRRLRRGGDGAAGHKRGSEHRANGGVADVDGSGKAGAFGGGGAEEDAGCERTAA